MAKQKGKAPKGRAKQKARAQGGGSQAHQSPRFAHRALYGDGAEDYFDEPSQFFRGFTQGKQQLPHTPYPPTFKLRHQAISFVSAGEIAPTVPIQHTSSNGEENGDNNTEKNGEDENDDSDADIDDSAIQTNIILDTDLEISQGGMARMKIEGSTQIMRVQLDGPMDQDSDIDVVKDTQQRGKSKLPEPEMPESVPWVVDLQGDPGLARHQNLSNKSRVKRPPSPSPSSSSSEVIVFHGRNNQGKPLRDIGNSGTRPSLPESSKPKPEPSNAHVTDELLNALKISATPSEYPLSQIGEWVANTSQPSTLPANEAFLKSGQPFSSQCGSWAYPRSKPDPDVKPSSIWTPAPSYPYWRKRKSNPEANFPPTSSNMKAIEGVPTAGYKQTDAHWAEDAGAEDTIASLQADWKQKLRTKKSAKQDENSPNDAGSSKSKPSRRNKRGRKKSNRQLQDVELTEDDDDTDGEAAYDDYIANLGAQMDGEESTAADKFVRSAIISGSSLIVDGKEFADDEFLPNETKAKQPELDGTMEIDNSSDWESEHSDELSSEESLDASDLEDELEYTEKQQWEDEEDLRQRRIDRMTDEQIARLFAKQEELGIGGDDLLIDDGAYVSSSEGVGDVGAARAAFADITNLATIRKAKGSKGRSRGGKRDFFPDASIMADTMEQYGNEGFDIMDFDRPSLRPTKKGRKGKLPPDLELLSDEELKNDLNETWERDRLTKRQKKIQREELRMQGLLGTAGKKGVANLGEKYSNGMSIDHMQEELKEFLLNERMQQRAFPPMDKRNRKALHEVALALNLTSKSQGAGKKRFPVLFKTSRTPEYSDDLFQRVMFASSRGYLTSRGKAGKIAKSTARGGRGGGGGASMAGASLRNGEIVGAGAAEIGQESFGHRLMEKMGWTKGQALGKDGEGLLVPVEQRMRMGTAGLG